MVFVVISILKSSLSFATSYGTCSQPVVVAEELTRRLDPGSEMNQSYSLENKSPKEATALKEKKNL